MRELILGGARSGKSAYAERLALATGLDVTYLATAQARDKEMAVRIEHHRQRRPGDWQLVEAPLELAAALQRYAATDRCLLVDCLTLWLSNLLAGEQPDEVALVRRRNEFLELLPALPGRVILVSNEVGLGIVPLGELSRRFCDESGRLHQAVAERCERVTFVTAGLPMTLKREK
ncbi:MAG: bifunctional adenosylcobinamide kinase/adenosylcobinamide-phosphate guanylyltransferase [Gammaproteobacteria bacterium]|nr:bifunctional adenosylcobinamide kinase/adenosylcobinamide-phosphate guanylyltransferase [Gammaproteobacteria bacterium]MCW8841461.1 bifunctional adenosylcobinamide kinase/adenosylcobinamide-phosphate guanylyltransferase [Gammaproteobacteria bacterium]MCW8958140.1 bifunctional adenosylcobinamide kinase/adenosylcobinamide-phosphate guanylyltransferase [Gammaproteobacteria bacterium]MCW8973867.1 bifunctional adenosylcobinamide kinase/adenosylcobinamide-phosphate guanylyltransferase [Gammaproteob